MIVINSLVTQIVTLQAA
jgi:hypothetical protein